MKVLEPRTFSERADHFAQAYWRGRNQIKVCESISEAPRLAKKSKPEDWIDTGRMFVTRSRSGTN